MAAACAFQRAIKRIKSNKFMAYKIRRFEIETKIAVIVSRYEWKETGFNDDFHYTATAALPRTVMRRGLLVKYLVSHNE